MKALAPVAALLLSVALVLMGNGLQGALLPLRAGIDGQTALEIGILGSSYFLGFGAGCYMAAYFIERSGHIRAFAAAVALASTTALLHALVTDPLVWWMLRAMTGFCFAVIYTVIESWLNDKSDDANRGTIFSVYTIINLTVLTIGQFMLVFGDPSEFPLFTIASILVSLSAIPVALSRAEAPAPPQQTRLRLGHLYRLSPAGTVGAFAVGTANGTFWALGPIYAAQSLPGLSGTEAVAFFMSAVVLGGALGQWPLGRWSDRLDRRLVIVAAACCAAGAGGALFFLSAALGPGLIALAALFGFFAFPLYALSVAHTNDVIDRSAYVEAASGLLLLYGIGAVIGPLIAATLAGFTEVRTIFAFTAAVHVALVLFIAYRIARRTPSEEPDQPSFSESLIAAQTVSPIETGRE